MANHPNPTSHFERSTKEYVILCISLAGVVSITPFAAYRIVSQDIMIALLDSLAVASMAAIFIYVFRTSKTTIAAWILTATFFLGLVFTIKLKGAEQILWAYPVSVGIYYLISAPKAAVVNSISIIIIYLTIQHDLALREKGVFIITLVSTNVFTYVFAFRNELQKQKLEQLSFKDPLTGTYNKRSFDIHLSELDETVNLGQSPYSMVFLDIDYFKKVNDTFGHPKGDEVLIKLASLINIELNLGAKLYRIGGEEYAIFPLKMNEPLAKTYSERLRTTVENSALNDEFKITISIGIATYESNESLKQWMERADEALYAAKRSGRNCSVVSSSVSQIEKATV